MTSTAPTPLRRLHLAVGKGKHPPTLQVAALCWRRSKKGLRILLVTSRDSGRWVIPKGWPMRKRTDWDAAAREAWEEAGVRGTVLPEPIGLYIYRKVLDGGQAVPCAVQVYPLEVHMMLREYPENGQRHTRWFPPKKAARRVREPQLADLLRNFDPGPLPGAPVETEIEDDDPAVAPETSEPALP